MTDNYNAQSAGDAVTKEVNRPPAFYACCQENEGIPIHEVLHIDNLMDVELGPSDRFGVPGAFINLADPFVRN